MNALEYLKSISRTESFIESKKLRLKALNDLINHVPGPVYSNNPRVTKSPDSSISNIMNEAIDLENEIDRDRFKVQSMKSYMLSLIRKINNPDEEQVLIKRYFNKMAFDEIAQEMGHCQRWIYVHHKKAIEKLNEMDINDNACS